MKRRIWVKIASCVMAVVLLSGCTINITRPTEATTATTTADTTAAETTTSATETTTTSASKSTAKSSTTKKKTTTTSKKTTTTTKPVHTHSYTKEVVPATCTAKGYTKYTCACGHSYTGDHKDPSHSFSKYVCTKCGEVDKSHAYEYLVEWVKQNGKANGTHMSFEVANNNIIYTLGYDAQGDCLSVITRDYSNSQVELAYASIDLKNYYYFVSFYGDELFGLLSPDEFTENSTITYISYKGSESDKYEFIELSRLSLDRLLAYMDWFLETTDIGIELKDLGFTAY